MPSGAGSCYAQTLFHESETMRVLINGLQAGNLSGTGRYTTELARRLPGLFDDVEVAVIWPRHVPAPHVVSGRQESLLARDAAHALKRVYRDQIGLRIERARLQADVVHYPANIGPLARMRSTVLTVHDLSFLRRPDWFRADRAAYYRFTVGRSARSASRIIADSQSTAADLREFLGISSDRIDVIPLGVGEEFQSAGAESQDAMRGWHRLPERFFLYVGTLEPRKNLIRLIEAFSRVAPSCPHDLVLAGREGWKVKPIRAAAAASPYAKRIHFPGFIAQEDLPAVLSAAQVFVWPSLYEGFGLPPLEAMACGTPVVTSNASSLPEVVGEAAIQTDPTDVDQIAGAMLDAATDETLRAALKEEGRRRAAMFTWEETARKTTAVYRAAAADKGTQ
jgi:glycosyltransferase involved in cell wall biosynthesis